MKAETKLRVAACAAGFALPRYNDLPSVGLYLDQTVQYVNGCFRTFCGVELTSSMVSNYVKKGILSHPVRKKYSREQLACLLYIVVSKTVLSMENIDSLFKITGDDDDAKAGLFLDKLEKLSKKKLDEYLAFSNKFCGISVQSNGAIDSYPTLEQMQ